MPRHFYATIASPKGDTTPRENGYMLRNKVPWRKTTPGN